MGVVDDDEKRHLDEQALTGLVERSILSPAVRWTSRHGWSTIGVSRSR